MRNDALWYGILSVLILSIVCGTGSAYENLSVYSYGTNYIVWNASGNENIIIDGVLIESDGLFYVQNELAPGTEHIGCNLDGNCTGIVTSPNGMSVFLYWGVYLIMIGFIFASYLIPITAIPCIVFGTYLISSYLPSTGADGSEYALVGILMAVGILAAIAGWRRL